LLKDEAQTALCVFKDPVVPRSKDFIMIIKTNHLTLYRAKVASLFSDKNKTRK
jgi:hypothetical protein